MQKRKRHKCNFLGPDTDAQERQSHDRSEGESTPTRSKHGQHRSAEAHKANIKNLMDMIDE